MGVGWLDSREYAKFIVKGGITKSRVEFDCKVEVCSLPRTFN